jgi:hypothetical protein
MTSDDLRITLYLSADEYRAIRSAAQADSRSINSWCKLTLLAKIQGTQTVVAKVAPGQDVIVQNRAKNGRFTPRSK